MEEQPLTNPSFPETQNSNPQDSMHHNTKTSKIKTVIIICTFLLSLIIFPLLPFALILMWLWMRTWSKWTKLLITCIGIVLILLVANGLFTFLMRFQTDRIEIERREQEKQLQIITEELKTKKLENWKTYQGKNFSVKLPPQIEDFTCEQKVCRSISTSLNDNTRLVSIQSGSLDFSPELKWTNIAAYLKQKNIAYSEKILANKTGYLITTSDLDFIPFSTSFTGYKQGVVLPIENEQWISFFLYRADKDSRDIPFSQQETTLFEQILSTFRLLNEN